MFLYFHKETAGPKAGVKQLLLRVKVGVERLDELVDVNAVHEAGFGQGLGGGVRAVQAVHTKGHEDRSNFRIKAHHRGDAHIGGDHGATFFLRITRNG